MIVIPTIVVGMGWLRWGFSACRAAWGVEAVRGHQPLHQKWRLRRSLGSILSGGTAPLVAAALLSWTGHWWPIALYFAVMAGIGLVTTFFARKPEVATSICRKTLFDLSQS
ncbi:Uncharacterised protein [Cedecea neteri]|uniref:Uncharacterized protein n=1 Tax=Cedecea neteri TaxID=158822 RepID=A0A2X2SZX7_9ENTR|nr:Uncharacterised protein [Cedecea neteri]